MAVTIFHDQGRLTIRPPREKSRSKSPTTAAVNGTKPPFPTRQKRQAKEATSSRKSNTPSALRLAQHGSRRALNQAFARDLGRQSKALNFGSTQALPIRAANSADEGSELRSFAKVPFAVNLTGMYSAGESRN